MDILIDFDGTCVKHNYPHIGEDIGAVPVLKKLTDKGHNLILFTMRSNGNNYTLSNGKVENEGLTEAVNWFKENNIPLYGVQTNPTQYKWTTSPKAYGHLIIDDISLGIPLVKPENERPHVCWVSVEKLLIDNDIL